MGFLDGDYQEGKWKVQREEDELRQSLCHMIVTFAEMKFGAPGAATSRPSA